MMMVCLNLSDLIYSSSVVNLVSSSFKLVSSSFKLVWLSSKLDRFSLLLASSRFDSSKACFKLLDYSYSC